MLAAGLSLAGGEPRSPARRAPAGGLPGGWGPASLLRRRWSAAALLVAVALASGGCSVRKLAVAKLGQALAAGGGVYATDDDPQLVGDALPFALKTMESLLAQDPGNEDLLLATASGFTQYAWGWAQLPARRLQEEDWAAGQAQLVRARKLYLRGRDYGLRALEGRHPGLGERLRRDPEAAAAELSRDDVPLAFWTAAAWGAAISLGKDQPELLGDLAAVQALLARVLALDERWSGGAAHEVSIPLAAALPAAMGGGPDRARSHFDRAVELAGGRHAAPYLALAESVAIPAQDRQAFESLLGQALAVDLDAEPSSRLANVLARQQAQWLLDHADLWFLDGGDEEWDVAPEDATAPPAEAEEGGADGADADPQEPQPDPPAGAGGHP